MKWKSIQKPGEIILDHETATEEYGKFIIQPLEPGYGVTLGNALRRMLYSSLQGVAITAVRIDGVQHEFSTIPGVYEDVTEIILNLKGVRFKLEGDFPNPVRISVNRNGEITAKDIKCDSDVAVVNKKHHIATLTEKVKLKVDLDLGIGCGYNTAEDNKADDQPIGTIPIDSIFTPVLKANFKVESARVGQRTDYDKLTIEVTTDGTVTPREALSYSAQILNEHFQLFFQPEMELEREEKESVDEETARIRKLLQMKVSELELSVRSSNCLKAAKIKAIADLVQKTESEMLKYRNFGRKSLAELIEILDKLNLSFGMDISKYVDEKDTEKEK
ncbi:DNA-directed RNA polymerase subunit alpha [bacterium]|nr:DNA-directed RNA polymerase subunit alpha [bacterium]